MYLPCIFTLVTELTVLQLGYRTSTVLWPLLPIRGILLPMLVTKLTVLQLGYQTSTVLWHLLPIRDVLLLALVNELTVLQHSII